MATPGSQFIIKKLEGFGGNFLDSQYLGAAYETGKPEMLESALMKIYSARSRYFTAKPLLGMTGAKKIGTKEISTEMYRWRLTGAEERFAVVLENVENSNDYPGLNNTTFKIKLNLDYYAHPDVLFGEDNEYPLAIQEGPIPDGTGFIYIVKIQGDNPTVYFPVAHLNPGKEFNRVWASVPSEYNQWFGTQQAPNSFLLESQLGQFAQAIHVTDGAMREEGRLAFDFMASDGNGNSKVYKSFMPYYEARMWDELYKSMEVQMVYGKKQTQPGKDKYWIKTGPGMREQLRDSWIEYYNGPLTVSALKDYLFDIFYSREDETNRAVTAMTGTLGSMLWHDALAAIANGFLTVDTHFINAVASPTQTPHLAYGAQFTRYNGPEGIVVDIVKNPMYDSREFCKRMHPQYPNIPIDSARFTFLDFGSSGSDNNIMMLKMKDSFKHGYTVGLVGPNGPVQGGQVTSLKNGYDVGAQGSAGFWIKDVTRCGEYIYDYEY